MRWTSQVISWAATLYAVRILAPGDFGLVAMAMLAIGLARMVQDFGLDAVFIQDRKLTSNEQSQLAGLLIAFGMLLALLFSLSAPLIAKFFHEPRVTFFVVALSSLFVLDAVQVIPYARLQRELRFRELSIVALAQVLASSLALTLAVVFGLGTWSLVVNTIAGEIAVTLLLLTWAPYPISRPQELRKLSGPLLQGWRLLVGRLAYYSSRNADQTFIGRTLGKDLLGAYSMALTFSTLAQKEIGSVLSRVIPGIFSEVQGRPDELRRYFLLLTDFVTMLSFPFAIGMALIADLMVPLFLGPQWYETVAPLRWLCMYSAITSAFGLIGHVLIWTGQFRVSMWLSVLAGALMPVALYFAVRYGLEGVGIAWVMADPLLSIPGLYFAFRTLRISAWDWLNSFGPAAIGCASMAAAVWAVRIALPPSISMGAELAVAITTGLIVYPAVVLLVFPGRVRAIIAVGMTLRRIAPTRA